MLILEKVQNGLTPESFQVVKVFPNPFNPVTNINFSLPNSELSEQFVTINIYDLTGKIVKEIYNGKMKKDDYKIQWDGTNNFGTHVSAGVYLLTVNTNKFNYNKKLLFLK
jgi:flagellar hook assembly protein FlgD